MATSLAFSSLMRMVQEPWKILSRYLSKASRRGFNNGSPTWAGPPMRKMASGAEKVTALAMARPSWSPTVAQVFRATGSPWCASSPIILLVMSGVTSQPFSSQ